MNNAVLLVYNRPLLTQQCLKTFFACSKLSWNLTIVDDGSDFQTREVIKQFVKQYADWISVLHMGKTTKNTALLRNLGIYFSEHYFGRGEYLYTMDNDSYFTNSWDIKLIETLNAHERIKLIGPYRHPYHHPNLTITTGNPAFIFQATDAVQGIGHLTTWETWDTYGPLSEHKGNGFGTNQSEDYAFCRKIVDAGFLVGSIEPEVVHNCGLTDSQGKPCIGSETMTRIEGIYYE